MTPSTPQADDALYRVLRRRFGSVKFRTVQAVLIAGLCWQATGDPLVIAWFGVALALRVAEGLSKTAVLAHAGDPVARRWIVAGLAFNALSFAAIAVVLLRHPDPMRLAEVGVLMCAISLGNALQAAGSRAATFAMVGPASVSLCVSPLWVYFAGGGLPINATLLLAVGGIAYSSFILHISASLHRDAQAARIARRVAQAGEARWRLMFDQSPMPRLCFDASTLHQSIQARGAGRGGFGDVLRSEMLSVETIIRQIRLIEANPAAIELCGERVAKAHFTESFVDAFCGALNAIDEHGTLPPFEAELICADNRRMVMEIHYRMADGPDGPWSQCLATYVDVTQRHRAAQAREEARQAAEAANRAKSDFLATMSHEIRTPLNGVLGMAQAMERDLLAPVQRERLKVIRHSGAALMDLLDDLLDLSRIDGGRLQLETHDFDLRATVEAAHAAFAAEAQSKGLAYPLQVDPAASGLWRGDSDRVRQILSNLISNAVKFTHRGEVAVRLAKSASGIRLEVADTGIGIPADRVARLFEKFVQADASATRAYGGTGLGLAICHELCRAMGGAITVGSAPGSGSTFALELPLRQVESVEPEGPPQVWSGPAEGVMRVLAAEDNPVNREVLKALLAQFDLEPTIVTNGAEAVRAWESAHWDLILMDVQMPVMDGPTAAMTIRAREGLTGRARTPIVAVTANTQAHQVASYRAAGMDDVVGKPINVAELFAAMVGAAAGEPAAQHVRKVS
jgi:signal transduction histidine kinase/ActR/RegA family two-component response regulator